MYLYIIMLEISNEISEQLDQGKTKCNKEYCTLSSLMKQSLKNVNNINHQVIVTKIKIYNFNLYKLFFLDYKLILKMSLS